MEAELKKEGMGKGLPVLSGRALFDQDATLFEVSRKKMTQTKVLSRATRWGGVGGGGGGRGEGYSALACLTRCRPVTAGHYGMEHCCHRSCCRWPIAPLLLAKE